MIDGVGAGREAASSSSRTRVRRLPARGRYDKDTIYRVLDDALLCYVALVADQSPHVIPMTCARHDDELLLHGSTASRLMRILTAGSDVCVCVTHLDGVVIARSIFDTSMNYRSVVIFGRARALVEQNAKLDALRLLVDRLIPGRWSEARPPTEQELKSTTVLAVSLAEASAKVRVGGPQDDEDDLALPFWAGEIPLRTISLAPVADARLAPDVPVPLSVQRFRTERVAGVGDA